MERKKYGRSFWYLLMLATMLIVPMAWVPPTAAGFTGVPGTRVDEYNNNMLIESITTLVSEEETAAGDSVVIPLCPAGTTFDAGKYPQNTLQSDPMVFECYWDGTGRVYLSGDRNSLTETYADDGFSVTIQPAGTTFHSTADGPSHHPVMELTSGMTPGKNSFSLVVENNGLSLWYGLFPSGSISQTPYIVQVTDAASTVTVNGTPATGKSPFNAGIGSVNKDTIMAWTLVTPDAGWPVRAWHSCVVMPDGSIVIMGGMDKSFSRKNDVWRSADNGTIWTLVNPRAEWSPRYGQSSVVLPDGSIVLMGGYQYDRVLNDTWRSTDMGLSWTRMSAGSGWPARWEAGSVVLPDGSILLMGGGDRDSHNMNDTWLSTDKGATWMPVNMKAGWPARRSFQSVILADGSILLMGGADTIASPRIDVNDDTWWSTDNGRTWNRTGNGIWDGRYDFSSIAMQDGSVLLMGGVNKSILRSNDILRSADFGETWSLMTDSAPWSPRYGQCSVLMPDGSVVLTGGSDSGRDGGDRNDVWRFKLAETAPPSPSGPLIVTKVISPSSLKAGTDAKITITVRNGGKTPVHDVEILDTTLPEFPVIHGSPEYSTPSIGPDDTRILTYWVSAAKAGTYRLNRTNALYADIEGNYHYAYSNYENVNVLASLLQPRQQQEETGFFQDLMRAVNKFLTA